MAPEHSSTLTERAEQLGNIAILTGGISPERPIALASGAAVLASLQSVTQHLQYIDLTRSKVRNLAQLQADVVFLALHGTGGEDGSIQGLLQWLGIPYTGSGVMSSALAMDKYTSKLIWQALDLPTPHFQLITKEADLARLDIPLPLAIKPAQEGSSIGISKITRKEQLIAAWQQARTYGTEILAESWVTGPEFTLAFLGDLFLPMIKVVPQRGFYDYAAKYQSGNTQYVFEHGLTAAHLQTAHTLAKAACQALHVMDFGRVDMILDQQDQFQLLEVNTIPGMTTHSLLPKAAERAGIHFTELVIRMLELAKRRR